MVQLRQPPLTKGPLDEAVTFSEALDSQAFPNLGHLAQDLK